MIRFLLRTLIFVASAALGLLAADLTLDGFSVTASGFVITVVVFAVLQSVLSPFIAKMVARYAPAFLGGIGLVSCYVALLIASLVGSSLTIDGASTWVLATIIVWLVTALATFLLPFVLLRKAVDKRGPTTRSRRRGKGALPST